MVRKLFISLGLGASLLLSTGTPAFAHPHSPEEVAQARRVLAEFFAFTERNWSPQGYSSAAQMRQLLGNSQTNWLTETAHIAGVNLEDVRVRSFVLDRCAAGPNDDAVEGSRVELGAETVDIGVC